MISQLYYNTAPGLALLQNYSLMLLRGWRSVRLPGLLTSMLLCVAICRSWREMCKEIGGSLEFCGMRTFPVSLKQPGPRDETIQCITKRDKSSLTYHLFLCLSPALLVENGKFLLSAKRNRRTTCIEYIISMDAGNISRSSNTYIGKLRLGSTDSRKNPPNPRNTRVDTDTHAIRVRYVSDTRSTYRST